MAPNSLSPASILVNYHSLFGAHKMTIPTKEWIVTDITGTLGSYQAWDGSSIDAQAMVTDLLTVLAHNVPSSTVFDDATVYTMATPTSDNIPRKTVSLAIPGVLTTTNFWQAVSLTWNLKTLANGDMKIVLLDAPYRSTWMAKIRPAAFTVYDQDLRLELAALGNAWAGRDDSRPEVLRTVTTDLNDKLQKMYFK